MQINLRLPPAYRYLCQYEIQQQTNDRRKPPVPDGMDGDYPSTGPQLENARRGTRQSGEHSDRLAKNRTLSADLHHPQQPDRSQTVTAKTSLKKPHSPLHARPVARLAGTGHPCDTEPVS